MAIELIVEVLRHAPCDLTPAERLVLIVIAEAADRNTRKCWPSRELIAQRTGLGLSGLKKTFQRLAAKGYEVRIPIGKDKGGRLVFAHERHRTEYLLPRFDIHSPAERGDVEAPTGSREGTPQGLSGGTVGSKRGDERAAQSFTEPLEEPSSSARASYRRRIAGVAGGTTDDEINLILEQIKKSATKPIRALGAYIATISDQDIHDHAAVVIAETATRQAAQQHADLETHRRWAAAQSDCDHGKPGGWLIRPDHGDPKCPLCRRDHQEDPDAYLAWVAARMKQEGI